MAACQAAPHFSRCRLGALVNVPQYMHGLQLDPSLTAWAVACAACWAYSTGRACRKCNLIALD